MARFNNNNDDGGARPNLLESDDCDEQHHLNGEFQQAGHAQHSSAFPRPSYPDARSVDAAAADDDDVSVAASF